MSNNHSDRREFLQTIAGAGIAVMVLPVLQSCGSSPTGTTGDVVVDVSSINQTGKSLVTSQTGSDGKHIAVVCQAKDSFLALSMECRHQQCEVNAPGTDSIVCPCHGSTYDLQGNVLKGPTTAPLRRYTTEYDATSQKLTIKMS